MEVSKVNRLALDLRALVDESLDDPAISGVDLAILDRAVNILVRTRDRILLRDRSDHLLTEDQVEAQRKLLEADPGPSWINKRAH